MLLQDSFGLRLVLLACGCDVVAREARFVEGDACIAELVLNLLVVLGPTLYVGIGDACGFCVLRECGRCHGASCG